MQSWAWAHWPCWCGHIPPSCCNWWSPWSWWYGPPRCTVAACAVCRAPAKTEWPMPAALQPKFSTPCLWCKVTPPSHAKQIVLPTQLSKDFKPPFAARVHALCWWLSSSLPMLHFCCGACIRAHKQSLQVICRPANWAKLFCTSSSLRVLWLCWVRPMATCCAQLAPQSDSWNCWAAHRLCNRP